MPKQETGGDHIVISFMIELLNNHYWGDQIKETERMGPVACIAEKRNTIQSSEGGKLKEWDHLENLSIHGKGSMKMDPKEIVQENVEWIHLFQDRYK